ncbi:hypothetical protein SAMN04487995_5654 [Dyadobacter koreensis]|uniref:Uncharacterized protein n=1 Tax=Dyadobacter koreensis TaxID=408657 RepID=A0A1H7AG05_9BACT|nr:hypothetical protein [Dyadobacter koreensis]SEJ63876.1 hypothetical protein SAMN04487995_5654 [Dyadobacter koreensis]
MRFFTPCIFFILSVMGDCVAQLSDAKAITSENVPSYPLSLYKAATVDAQNLYNGRLYYIYDSQEEEFQFFDSRKLVKGTVYYDGQRYEDIPMMYDIVRDELIITHANGYENILLQSPKVKYFSVHDHNFKRFESGQGINADMKTGFYDQVYMGKTKILVRRTKQRQEKIVEKKVIALFPDKNFFYVFKDGKYHSVHSKKSLFALFPEQKRELRKELREQKNKFRKNREKAIVAMVARYDELTKP